MYIFSPLAHVAADVQMNKHNRASDQFSLPGPLDRLIHQVLIWWKTIKASIFFEDLTKVKYMSSPGDLGCSRRML